MHSFEDIVVPIIAKLVMVINQIAAQVNHTCSQSQTEQYIHIISTSLSTINKIVSNKVPTTNLFWYLGVFKRLHTLLLSYTQTHKHTYSRFLLSFCKKAFKVNTHSIATALGSMAPLLMVIRKHALVHQQGQLSINRGDNSLSLSLCVCGVFNGFIIIIAKY